MIQISMDETKKLPYFHDDISIYEKSIRENLNCLIFNPFSVGLHAQLVLELK